MCQDINQPVNANGSRVGGRGCEVAFTQAGAETEITMTAVAGTNGRTCLNIACFGCQKNGHCQSQWPNAPAGESDAHLLLNAEFSDFLFLH